MKLKVTAYVPCYNAERYLAATLRGLLSQTHTPDEIIVVDDGSTDGTARIARDFPVLLVQHAENKGLAAARNTAARHATHPFIASVDADVVADESWLQRLLEAFCDDTIAGAGGRCIERFQTKAPDRWRALHLVQDLGPAPLRITPEVNQGLSGFAAVFRKSALERVGGYDERYRTNWEDWDISVKLRRAGYTLIYDPGAVASHIRRDTALSVLRTAWRWVFWIRYHEGSYDHVGWKLLQNARKAAAKALQHLGSGDIALLPIDYLYFFCFCYWDLRFFARRDT